MEHHRGPNEESCDGTKLDKPIARSAVVPTGPFLMRGGHVERTVITVVDLIGVLDVVHVVLVVNSWKAWKKSGVQCVQVDASGRP